MAETIVIPCERAHGTYYDPATHRYCIMGAQDHAAARDWHTLSPPGAPGADFSHRVIKNYKALSLPTINDHGHAPGEPELTEDERTMLFGFLALSLGYNVRFTER